MSLAASANSPLSEPAWNWLLAAYFILIGVPSGITLIVWWLRQRRDPGAWSLERHGSWIAMAALVAASALLIIDLGRPARFYLMLTRFDNLQSPIAVGAKLIAVKMFLLVVVLFAMERRRRGDDRSEASAEDRLTTSVNRALPWLLLASSFGLAIYPAAVLARSWASPLAGSSGSSLIFLLTALLMGAAVTVLIAVFLGPPNTQERSALLRFGQRSLLTLMSLFGVALVFEGLSLAGDPPDRLILGELLTGGLAARFWGLVVGIGMIVPTVGLSVAAPRRVTLAICAVAVLVGSATTRYLIFTAGR